MSKTQIITRIGPAAEPVSWQHQLADSITQPTELLKALDLPSELLKPAEEAKALFPLRVTRSYLQRMEKANPSDPLLLQVLPQLAETLPQPAQYGCDPLNEMEAMPVPGLLHKYHGRLLLICTEACAIHCRYCFRREFPYRDSQAGRDHWADCMDYIRNDTSIEEVILSGGDPLTLSNQKLADLVGKIETIPQVTTLRIHTRLPIVLPARIDTAFLTWIKQTRLKIVLVVHSNHPHEIDAEVGEALTRLYQAEVLLLNQTVLLKNINDNTEILSRLNKVLFTWQVVPYYLHLMDKVIGAAHFEIPRQNALEIYDRLSSISPGYLLPRLVTEIPGLDSKTIVSGFPGGFV